MYQKAIPFGYHRCPVGYSGFAHSRTRACFPREPIARREIVNAILDGRDTEIVPKPEQRACLNGELVRLSTPKGSIQVQHHRWKIKRTFGWLIRYRRLARDYKSLPFSSEKLIHIASIRLFLTRLAPFP